jgi:serine/threonine protein kinase
MHSPLMKRDRTIRPGMAIGRFRVEGVVSSRPDVATIVDARAGNWSRVTLTVLAEPVRADKERREAIVKLADARATLEHPHLLPALAAFEDGGRTVFATAFKGPLTLADRLREGPLEPQKALRILGQVAAALELAATKGLVHRDLTPEAIALRERAPDHAFLGDFGIAHPLGPACAPTGATDGVDYRSPEELRGESPGPRSNVYSLACILVECLTGEPPYRHDRPLLTIHAHMVERPPRITQRRKGLPHRIDDVIARALAKDPRDRHRSPAQLVAAAGHALGVDVRVPVAADVARQQRRDKVAPREHRREKVAARDHRRESPHEDRKPVKATKPAKPAKAAKPIRPARPRARPAWATALACAALVLSAASGFATGTADWSGDSSSGGASRLGSTSGASTEASAPTAQQADYVLTVDRVLDRLGERRAELRRKLGAAQQATGQAAVATTLSVAYAEARKALPEATAAQFAELRLEARLAAVARGYRHLSAAAKKGHGGSWNRARREAARSEASVVSAVRQLSSSYSRITG